MSLFEGKRVSHIPTAARKVYDVTGAGDTVIAAFTLALISGVVVSTMLTLVVIPLLYYMYLKTVGVEKVVTIDDSER